MTTAKKDHLLTAESFKVSRGIGLRHGGATITIRLPDERKEQLDALVEKLVSLGRTEGKQDFLREIIYKAMDEYAIAPTPSPEPTPAKKPRGKKSV